MPRILTALVAVPLLLLLLLAAPAWAFAIVAAVTALAGYRELDGLAGRLGQRLLAAGYVATAALVVSFHPEVGARIPIEAVLLFTILSLGVAAVGARVPARETLVAVAMSVFAVFYLGVLLGALVGLRGLPPDPDGRRWTIFLLAVVMLGDASAYYVGRSLGRRALAPRLSPKKTVEGFLGGLAASILSAAALARFSIPDVGVLEAAALGLSISLFGVVGDLFESLLKRSVGVKDTSALIPGHGGVLDRIDSILFAAPVVYLYRLVASV